LPSEVFIPESPPSRLDGTAAYFVTSQWFVAVVERIVKVFVFVVFAQVVSGLLVA
jgi:hypothetical protein